MIRNSYLTTMIDFMSSTVVFIHRLYNIYSNLGSYKEYFFFLDNLTDFIMPG